jgi:hypothetical protein
MPQALEWLIEDRVLFSRMWGEMTVEELRANSDNGIAMSDAVTHDLPVHTILDGRKMTDIPSMKDMLGIKYKRARNTGWIIMILSTNRLYKFMSSTFLQLVGVHFKIVETWSDAVSMIASADSTLPDLSYLPEKMEHSNPLEG